MNNAPDKPRKALGKGLSALLPARPAASDATPVASLDRSLSERLNRERNVTFRLPG